eukprot:3785529-Rhodomonas_salina.3
MPACIPAIMSLGRTPQTESHARKNLDKTGHGAARVIIIINNIIIHTRVRIKAAARRGQDLGLIEEDEGCARAACAASAAGAMDEHLDLLGHAVVHDEVDVVDVEAACRNLSARTACERTPATREDDYCVGKVASLGREGLRVEG